MFWRFVLPEGDIAWKHFRLCGIHIVLAFAYLEHSIGMTGRNLSKIHKLHELTDGGRRKLIAVGDWNMHPDVLSQYGMLELLGRTIVTAGATIPAKPPLEAPCSTTLPAMWTWRHL